MGGGRIRRGNGKSGGTRKCSQDIKQINNLKKRKKKTQEKQDKFCKSIEIKLIFISSCITTNPHRERNSDRRPKALFLKAHTNNAIHFRNNSITDINPLSH